MKNPNEHYSREEKEVMEQCLEDSKIARAADSLNDKLPRMKTPREWRYKMSPAYAAWYSWEWEEFISEIQDDALRSKPGRDTKLKETESLLAEKNETANVFMAQVKKLQAAIALKDEALRKCDQFFFAPSAFDFKPVAIVKEALKL